MRITCILDIATAQLPLKASLSIKDVGMTIITVPVRIIKIPMARN